MAAPLPGGFGLQALPTAPVADPRLFAMDPQGALASAQAGLLLGKELAGLENQRAKRELEKSEIAYLKLKNAHELNVLDYTAKNLPDTVAAGVQKTIAEGKKAEADRMFYEALIREKVPDAKARTESLQADATNIGLETNAEFGLARQTAENASMQAEAARKGLLANAKVDPVTGKSFDTSSAPEKAQLLAKEKPFEPTPFEKEWIDPVTQNKMQQRVTYDPRTRTYTPTEEPRVITQAKDAKSSVGLQKDRVETVQVLDLAKSLDTALEEYVKEGGGGVGQAFATNIANTPVSSTSMFGAGFSLSKRTIGAMFQSRKTLGVSAKIQELQNSLGHALFGGALTPGEAARLEGMTVTISDLADPARAHAKLKKALESLELKLQSYDVKPKSSAVPVITLDSAGNVVTPAAPPAQPPAQPPAAPAQPAMDALKAGKVVYLKGSPVPYVLGVDASGKPALVPAP